MLNAKFPNKEELTIKLINNFIRPGVRQIFIEEVKNNYNITIVMEELNPHIIDNLMELEETVSLHNKVKFFYRDEWSSGELIWSSDS